MEIILWIIIIALFIGCFIGIVFPIIPSVLFIWLGFIIYHFGIDGGELNTLFWIAMILLTVVLVSSDIIANSYFVKRFGGSKEGERAAAIAVIIGSFITPPFGIIYVPFIAVFLIELIMKRTVKQAFRASIGSLIGFLSGTAAKVILQLLMIAWFFILVIF
ncbi:DUF456 domain-containing protein [Oceanobacillus luteolus]|uniref:DUF456 domain-containing protein n=1 Tax=Oceanobacillus luteolus TaxID=1274358 RepID=A0ABW4HPE7_9BACI|nr:DUF456 domain-containing protein [Oceanobacillus luteolus]MCM3740486.1 DUF456 domain-containing protein [Oceanobacillus luteolus]